MTMTMSETKTAFMGRQGDVLVMSATPEIDKPKRDWKEVPRDALGRVVLQAGKVTGHNHAIASKGAKLLRAEGTNDALLLVDGGDAELVHEEHATIAIPDGRYTVRIQREWNGEISRRVED